MTEETPHTRNLRERPHPGPATYWKVALMLVLLTALEFIALYTDAIHPVVIPVFILLSAAKFSLVVMFYMHLRFDSRLFLGFFSSGVLLAVAVTVALLALFGVIA